jgi:hypothetical protein
MKRFVAMLSLLAVIVFAAPAAAQQPSEYWANDGHSLLVLSIKTGNTGQYLINVNETWMAVDQSTFTAEDESGRRCDILVLRPPFRAKLQYRQTGDEDKPIRTIIGLKVIEQYRFNENGDIVRPGHSVPEELENMDNPEYGVQLQEKERAR